MLEALAELDQITRRLRRECPWDREQDERSIVPHTVEEAYELADAVAAGDDEKLIDELGDVLFQVLFLSLLMEERGAGSLVDVAESMSAKLIRRHPHVFGGSRPQADPSAPGGGAEDVLGSDEVLANWDRIKREVEGRGSETEPFADVPENLPALLYARKVQRRAASAGIGGLEKPSRSTPARGGDGGRGGDEQDAAAHWLGEALFALVDVARRLRIDPELALRAATNRFRDRAQPAE